MWHSLKPICSQTALVFGFALFSLVPCPGFAQTPATNRPWAYLLLNDSSLMDDCLICGRPTIQEPMRGTFHLRLLDENPVRVRYALENIQFTAGTRPYRVTGTGTFEIGGEVAVSLQVSLQLQIDAGSTNKVCYFTNSTTTLERRWPMMDVTLVQTNGTFIQTYTLRLTAGPVREIRFSTVAGFILTSATASARRTGRR